MNRQHNCPCAKCARAKGERMNMLTNDGIRAMRMQRDRSRTLACILLGIAALMGIAAVLAALWGAL